MKFLKAIIGEGKYERLQRKIGLALKTFVKVRKLSAWSSEDLRTVAILQHFDINKVLDIGANVGQFAESLIDYGFKGEIISFEPTKVAFEMISKKSKKNEKWTIADRCAIGDYDGEVEINVSNNSVFSSIKSINSEYSSYNDDSVIIGKETVPIFKLNSLQEKVFSKEDSLFLKIDTQGFEKEVLNGADKVLKYAKGVKIEAPLIPIYKDVSWGVVEMLNYFKDKGFKCVSISEVGVNKKTGIVYEVDIIFIKDVLVESKVRSQT